MPTTRISCVARTAASALYSTPTAGMCAKVNGGAVVSYNARPVLEYLMRGGPSSCLSLKPSTKGLSYFWPLWILHGVKETADLG